MKKILALMAIVCLFASCSGGENGDNLPFLALWAWSDLAEPLHDREEMENMLLAAVSMVSKWPF